MVKTGAIGQAAVLKPTSKGTLGILSSLLMLDGDRASIETSIAFKSTSDPTSPSY